MVDSDAERIEKNLLLLLKWQPLTAQQRRPANITTRPNLRSKDNVVNIWREYFLF